MQPIRVKVVVPAEQHMLQEIVEGAVSIDPEIDVVTNPSPPPNAPDVLLVATSRDESETLKNGGRVLALDRTRDHVDLYELSLFERIRGSDQLASAIRRVATRALRSREE
jgi:hypothetical protein